MIPPHLFYQICMFFLEQNVANCQNTLTTHIEVEDLSSRCMNGSLPRSQDRLDRIYFVSDLTIPIIFPSG